MSNVVRLNQIIWRLAGLLAALTSAPISLAESAASDVQVTVVVGANAVPLDVKHRFRETAKVLPKPGELPVTDAHDQQHDSHTYCYRFGAKGHEGLLEFFDSDFGMHTARLSRAADQTIAACTLLRSQPIFTVNGTSFSLSSKKLPDLVGFIKEKKGEAVVLKRQWTYTDSSKPHQWGTCFSREASVKAKPDKSGFSSITVMNWDEPGC